MIECSIGIYLALWRTICSQQLAQQILVDSTHVFKYRLIPLPFPSPFFSNFQHRFSQISKLSINREIVILTVSRLPRFGNSIHLIFTHPPTMPSMPHSVLLALLLLAGFAHIFALAAPVRKVASLLPDIGNGSLPTHHHQFPPLVQGNDTANTTVRRLVPDRGNGSLPTHHHQFPPLVLGINPVNTTVRSLVPDRGNGSLPTHHHQFPPYLAPTPDGPRGNRENETSQSLPTHHHQLPPTANATLHWPGPILPRAENVTTLPTHHHVLPPLVSGNYTSNSTANATSRKFLPLLFGLLKAENGTTLPTHHHQLPPHVVGNDTSNSTNANATHRKFLPLLFGFLKAENGTTLPTHHHQLPPLLPRAENGSVNTTTLPTHHHQVPPFVVGNDTTNTTAPTFPPYVIRTGEEKEGEKLPPAYHHLPPILPRA